MTESVSCKHRSNAADKQKTIKIWGVLLPIAALVFGQLGSYLQYPQSVSLDNLIFTAIVLTLLGCFPASILIAVVTIVSAKSQSEKYNVLHAIQVISYFIIIPWAIFAGRCTIF